ncbi:MAG: hypothetical protein L3J42_03650, partial [Hydrogenimonas sp.]|nr:hypothetical protein [Hydrogenimonas sp.]
DVNLQLSNLIEEENPSLNFDDVSLPTIAILEEYAHEVDIDYTQVKMFDDMEKIKFIDNVFKEYAEEGYIFYHHEDFCKQRALGAFDEAKQAGLVSESGLYHYILLGTLTNQEIQNTVYYKRLLDLHSEEQKIEYLKNTISAIVMRRRRSDGI